MLILEGTIPAGFPDARICVDNITSYTEPCSALEPKPVKPVSSSSFTWAHYFGITFVAALALGLIVPILFLVGIIVVCRRRHQDRHSPASWVDNSKLFSTNLWHYIGGKEVSDDAFAEHTASMHRTPFKFPHSDMSTLAMRNGDMMDLPDVVIPGGRVVAMGGNGYGGTLGPNGTMRPQQPFNGYAYGASTMMTGKQQQMMGGGQPMMMNCYMGQNMMTSQPNFNMEYSGQSMMAMPHTQSAGNQQMMQNSVPMQCAPQMMQTENMQQSAVVPPSNYFQSLSQPAEAPMQPAQSQLQHQPQSAPVMIPAIIPKPVPAPAEPINATPVATTAPEENGIFVLPDPPSDNHDRDQAAALDALNAATESINVVESIGEHPPPGYDEAVLGLRKGAPANAPLLPPRRNNVNQQFQNQSPTANGGDGLSLAERYGLPVAEI